MHWRTQRQEIDNIIRSFRNDAKSSRDVLNEVAILLCLGLTGASLVLVTALVVHLRAF